MAVRCQASSHLGGGGAPLATPFSLAFLRAAESLDRKTLEKNGIEGWHGATVYLVIEYWCPQCGGSVPQKECGGFQRSELIMECS